MDFIEKLYSGLRRVRRGFRGSIVIPGLLILTAAGLLSIDSSVRAPLPSPTPLAAQKDITSWIAHTQQRCGALSERAVLDRCYRAVLRDAVRQEGTTTAVQVLELLRSHNVISAEFDDHQHVHEIGRATAEVLGVTGEAFLTCPTTYNYGCHHGFFEYALAGGSSMQETMARICEGLKPGFSPKMYSYCYHGAGHGVMMALGYDLKKSLAVCDSLSGTAPQEGCWQGVLMENTNAGVSDEAKVATSVSPHDPLFPCNALAQKYQWQCYINHAGYLMKRTRLDIKKSGQICLSAPNGGDVPCVQSIGLMVTNPIWQKSVRGVDTVNDPRKNVEVAWSLCLQMDPRAHKDCVIGAIGNILNFDETDITRARLFCDVANVQYRTDCYRQIGVSVAGQLTDQNKLRQICSAIPDQVFRSVCLEASIGRTATRFQSVTLTAAQMDQLISDDAFLKTQIQTIGPAQVIAVLSQKMPARDLSCHDRAHETGRMAYEVFGAESFRLCSSQCHSGCYHGAAEAYFHDKGTANLQENLATLCSGELNRFFSHQCVHGVGHGLMAWSNYELVDALAYCDTLESSIAQNSCWTGVFMENIVGGLAKESGSANFAPNRHYTRYLNNDPQYPCNSVVEKYKGACYFLQTSRMIQLYQNDFARVAAACGQAPGAYRRSCFLSMGRDVGGNNKHNVPAMIQNCQYALSGPHRQACLSGAVQDTFWDPSGQSEAVDFCSRLTDPGEVRTCWETIADRAAEILDAAGYEKFCKGIPSSSGLGCKPQSIARSYDMPERNSNDQTSNSKLPSTKVTQEQANSVVVSMKGDGYTPSKVSIRKGMKVVFTNDGDDLQWPASNIHPTHRVYPEFDAKRPISRGQSWEFMFDKAGTWQYHDHLLPYITGTIAVSE